MTEAGGAAEWEIIKDAVKLLKQLDGAQPTLSPVPINFNV